MFLSPRANEFFVDWDTIANDCVGILCVEAGRDPYDKRLSDLIGELSTRREELRARWAAHNVKLRRTGVKRRTRVAVSRRFNSWRAGRRHRRTRPPIGGAEGVQAQGADS